jgi:hypothetical protein
MQYNNLVAHSGLDGNRQNCYSWVQNYNEYITIPKVMSLAKASIPVTYLSFRNEQLGFYINVYNSVVRVQLINAYYDDVNEFLPMLNQATATAIGNNNFIWSYSTLNECLKLTCTLGTTFTIMSKLYASDSCAQRLGFISNLNYNSYLEDESSVVYAEGLLQLARTKGFFVLCNITDLNNCAAPFACQNILDYIPISDNQLKYGDVVTSVISNIPQTKVELPDNQRYNATSSIFFQILDDEMKPFTEPDRGEACILYINFDYD